MNRRTFDLVIAVNIGFLLVVSGLRVWSHAVHADDRGPLLTKTAKIVKLVTG